MPKTLRKNCFQLIKATKGRFLSLTAIVTLGVAFFVGVSASSKVMGESVDAYDDAENLKDITIYSNYGFEKEDIEAVAEADDIERAEGSYFEDVIGTNDTVSVVTRVHSYSDTDSLNHFVLKEGRLPANKNEALAEYGASGKRYFELGDTVKLDIPEDNENNVLTVDQVKIVGLINTPVYLCSEKENSTISNRYITTFLYMPEEAFESDYYLELDASVIGAKEMYAFGDAYQDYIAKVKEEVEDLAKIQEEKRNNQIKEEALSEYQEGLDEYNDSVETFQNEIAEAQEQLDDAAEEIANGWAQVNAGQEQLDLQESQLNNSYEENLKQLKDGLSEINTNRASLKAQREDLQNKLNAIGEQLYDQGISSFEELNETIAEANDGIEEIDSAIDTLQSNRDQFASIKKSYIDPFVLNGHGDMPINKTGSTLSSFAKTMGLSGDQTLAELDAAVSKQVNSIDQQITSLQEQSNNISASIEPLTTIKEGVDQLQDGITQIDTALATLDENEKKVNDGLAQLENTSTSARSQIAQAKEEIVNQQENLRSAEEELADGQAELDEQKKEGEQELSDAKEKLDEAKEEIDSLEKVEWTVLDRSEHYASAMFSSAVDQMAAIGNIFPLFFILVAGLVSLTTMTRLVNEERSEIGTLRALGYSKRQCAMKYVFYALSAAAIGCVLGTVVGMAVFPPLVYWLWGMMYALPDIVIRFPAFLVVVSSSCFIGMMLLTTLLSCRKDTEEVPAMLMRPKAPGVGHKTLLEKIPMIWNALSFSWKVTFRNIFRYKKRLFMTVIGIAGCSALLITGFGVRDSITDMMDRQFNHVLKYDGYVLLEDGVTQEKSDEIIHKIHTIKDIQSAEKGRMYNAYAYGNGIKSSSINIQVFEASDDIDQLYELNDMDTGKTLTLSDDGVILSKKLAENLGLSEGDMVEVEDVDGDIAEFQVSGICEMYINHYLFMTESSYEKAFGKELDQYSIYIWTKDDVDMNAVEESIVSIDGCSSLYLYEESYESFQTTANSLNAVVYALIISSMLLAFVVLGNLINVNISEREREIATLKVLGFRKKEVSAYIFRENNILTMVGALLGLPAGAILHRFLMTSVEMDYVIYGRVIPFKSYLISFALTIFFGWLVDQLMNRKLDSIQMVESLKSVE